MHKSVEMLAEVGKLLMYNSHSICFPCWDDLL